MRRFTCFVLHLSGALVLALASSAQALSLACSSYRVAQDQVEWSGSPIAGADAATFAVIDPDRSSCIQIHGRDHFRVYWRGQPVVGADPASFAVLANSLYARDRSAVYAYGVPISTRPADFRLLDAGYATDGTSLFWGTRRISGARAEVLERGYARDAAGVYFRGERLEGRDPATFTFIDEVFAKDARRVYVLGHPVPGANPASLRRLGKGYWRDRDAFYFGTTKIDGADPKTFHIRPDCAEMPYAADAHSLYYGGQRLVARDLPTFRCIGGRYSKDRYGIYRGDQLLRSADAVSFYVVRGFGFDKNYGYGLTGQHIERFCKRRDDVASDLSCCHIESSCRVR